MTLHNLAIDTARTGDWDRAWEIARLDVNPGVTKENWIVFALKCIGNRMTDDRREKQEYFLRAA